MRTGAVVCLIGVWAASPMLVVADDVTDAILNVDPRARLSSGVGVAYGSAYSQDDASAPAQEELSPDQVPSLSYEYGNAYRGLRSPLYEPEEEWLDSGPEEPLSPVLKPIPLGKPEQRDGVWYLDDLNQRR